MATPHCPSKVKELVVELVDGIDLEARVKWNPEFKWGVAVGCYGHFDTNCSTMGDLKVEAIQLGLAEKANVPEAAKVPHDNA